MPLITLQVSFEKYLTQASPKLIIPFMLHILCNTQSPEYMGYTPQIPYHELDRLHVQSQCLQHKVGIHEKVLMHTNALITERKKWKTRERAEVFFFTKKNKKQLKWSF